MTDFTVRLCEGDSEIGTCEMPQVPAAGDKLSWDGGVQYEVVGRTWSLPVGTSQELVTLTVKEIRQPEARMFLSKKNRN